MRGEMCTRRVLTTDVPRVYLDADGICTVCRDYEVHGENYRNYFKTEKDLRDLFTRFETPGCSTTCYSCIAGAKTETKDFNRASYR